MRDPDKTIHFSLVIKTGNKNTDYSTVSYDSNERGVKFTDKPLYPSQLKLVDLIVHLCEDYCKGRLNNHNGK